MNNFESIIINKNRGWRGLAEIIVKDNEGEEQLKMVFSFSQAVWDDLINRHTIVVADDAYYYIIHFDDATRLPAPTQQRSVLIKNFTSKIANVNGYKKETWSSAEGADWSYLMHHRRNTNNHTTSDWNCIGVRVIPEI